jgi:hypothetical protein
LQCVALRAGGCAVNAVAEVLSKADIVFLHTGCGRQVPVGHRAVDDVEACLPLVQPQLVVSSATPWIVLVAPLDVKDPVGRSAACRGENPIPAVYRVFIVPVWEDRVAVDGGRGQAFVDVSCAVGHELSIAVGRQVHRGKRLVIQCVGEG